jgi:protein-export membrane protein SecD
MKSGSWKTPFLFIWRKLSYLPRKLGNSIVDPSDRGKTRWAAVLIIGLVLYAGSVVYPQGYNKVATSLNGLLSSTGLSVGFAEEREFNLGLDLQGGAHLVYQANLEEVEKDEQGEALVRLRDRIERRVNSLGVSEPLVQVAGDDRLVVELAGVDIAEAISQIGATPLLEFRERNNEPPRELTEEEQIERDNFNSEQLVKAESAYDRVNSGLESFEDVARETTDDDNSRESGGDLGSITRATVPELYEALEGTLIGKVENTIIDSDGAFYIIRVDDRTVTDTEFSVSHILICYEGASGCTSELTREEALAKTLELKTEATKSNFGTLASENSTDPSAIENNGDLGYLAPGSVVPEFEEAAKALAVEQISEPVESDFGYHLILKQDERPLDEVFIHGIVFEKKVDADFLPELSEWKNTGLSGSNIQDAQLVFHTQTQAPQVSIQFDNEGTDLFAELTKTYLGSEIAIFLDGSPISIPTVQSPITNGQAVITGQFTIDEAQDLSRRLKDGALPVTIDLVQQQQVGASLGAESLNNSLRAGMIGLVVVAIFMLLYYRLLGLMAVLALGVYGLVTLALFKFIGVTLTLSGIAGFVLSIGMAVDANVLIFERFREERKNKKDLIESTKNGFDRAWPSIRDGNISTLITCFILGSFGTSLVQGFAVTLAIGILVSMFSAVIVTKTFVQLIIGWKFVRKFVPLFGSGWRLKG